MLKIKLYSKNLGLKKYNSVIIYLFLNFIHIKIIGIIFNNDPKNTDLIIVLVTPPNT